MNPTQEIQNVVDLIVISYCQYKKFKDEVFSNNFEKYVAQLMDLVGLDREDAIQYAVELTEVNNKANRVVVV